MARFFIPGYEDKRVIAEAVYEGLRHEASDQTGQVAHPRRISTMLCRRGGHDCTIDVGDRNQAIEGQTVVAILQLGREAFTIHCESTEAHAAPSTIEMDRHSVYSVSDFDA